MAIRTSEEEKLLLEKRNERKLAIKKYGFDFLSSFVRWIKIAGIGVALLVIAYLVAKLLFKWDLFYETDLDYTAFVFIATIICLTLVVICFIIAFIMYNTKHIRNTKYKPIDEGGNK